MTRRVAITGVGLVSPLGTEPAVFWNALLEGSCAIEAVTFDADGRRWQQYLSPLGELPVPGCVSETETNFLKGLSLIATYCAERALGAARLESGQFEPHRGAVILGSGFINLFDLESMYRGYFSRGARAISPLTIPLNMPSTPAGRLSMKFGLRGINKMVSTACSSASTAISEAFRLIRDGHQDVALTGGLELTACPTIVTCWERMRVLAPVNGSPETACRPFDRDRQGLVLGEGGAVFVLEELERAVRRGAPLLAEITAACETADGFDLVKPSRAGEVACLRGLFGSGPVSADDVGMIQSHGTATRLNDSTEYETLREVFGGRLADIPLCAIKSMIGHTMGASGAFNILAAIGSLHHGFFYPVPNLGRCDDGVRLNIVTTGERVTPPDHVLVNSFAFGGVNSCLAVSRLQAGAA